MNGDCNICINGKLPSYSASCVECGLLRKNYKPMTNADRIRSMTDEELADFLDRWEIGDVDYSKTFCDLCDGQYDCHDDCLMDWLKSPVEEGDNGI